MIFTIVYPSEQGYYSTFQFITICFFVRLSQIYIPTTFT